MGKGDALNYFFNNLEEKGVDVLSTSFPIYATPIGNTIRKFLTEEREEFGLSVQEDLEVKMSLFALNRLEFLEAFLLEDISNDTLIFFDRSPFSNALTIAYGMKNEENVKEEEIHSLVEIALGLDSLFVEKLNLKKCVIQLDTGEEAWESARGEDTDLYEVPQVQNLASVIYAIYQKYVGDGWKIVFTKEFDEGKGKRVWRDRDDIFNDIYSFLLERFGDFESRSGKGKRGQIGIREIMDSVYLGSKVDEDLLNDYADSIRSNDKELMYETAERVKQQICSSYGKIEFRNEDVRSAFRSILDRYPKIGYILEYNLGEEYILKLQEGLRDA